MGGGTSGRNRYLRSRRYLQPIEIVLDLADMLAVLRVLVLNDGEVLAGLLDFSFLAKPSVRFLICRSMPCMVSAILNW